MRVGIIDIGSNTVRLVIYGIEDGSFMELTNDKRFVGLLEYRRKGKITGKGRSILFSEIAELVELANILDVDDLSCFATEAIRISENRDDIIDGLKRQFNLKINLISADEEAIFGVMGAIRALGNNDGIYIDMGGGSVELTLVKDNVICETVSLPLGSLVLKEKFVKGILPTNKETKEIENYVREKFSSIEWLDSVEGGAIYALGGTARYMARLYDNTVKKENINGYLIKLPMLRKLIKKLQRDEIKGIKMLNMTAPQRLFTMLPGMQFFKELAQKSGLDSIYISKYGLREGYLVSQYSDILANETEQKMIDELLTK